MRIPLVLITTVMLSFAGVPVEATSSFEKSPFPDGQASTAEIPLDPLSITQLYDPWFIEGGGIACSGGGIITDNWWGRVYDLDGDHGITGEFCVDSLDYAIEFASDPTPIRFQVSCVPQGTSNNPNGFVTVAELDAGEVYSVMIDSGPAAMQFASQTLGGCCVAEESDLAMFMISADCQELGTCGGYWPGINAAGQTAPNYIGAPDCGIPDPIETGLLGFVSSHLIQVVHGDGTGGTDDGPTGSGEQQAKLTPDDGTAEDRFGGSAALDGDTAVIGARGDDDNGESSGSAYVFVRANGVWTEQAKLLPSDGAAGDLFGSTVVVDGDTALVGATEDDPVGSNSGSVYVFVRSDGTWTEQAKLVPSDGGPSRRFGRSIDLDGDTALIGSGSGNAGADGEAAYVFVRSGETWTEQARLVSGDAPEQDNFGLSVALDGDTAVIGAFLDDDNAEDSGTAYVFVRSNGVWQEQAKLLPSDGDLADWFGWTVALDGETAVIGSRGGGQAPAWGAAYVFVRWQGDNWLQQAKLVASDGGYQSHFAWTIAVDGDTVVVGADSADDNGFDSGAAYVYARTNTSWAEQVKLRPDDGAILDRFGCSVAVDGDTAIIGAYSDDDNGHDSGSAYVFGTDSPGDDDDDNVPAVGSFGALLILLTLTVVGTRFLRR